MKFTLGRHVRQTSPTSIESLEGRLLLHADDNPVGAGLLGEYFSTADQSTLVFARPDPAVNFAWGRKAPSPELPKDNFSVRWTGQYMPVLTGHYTFRVVADDGIRVTFN